MTHLGEISCLTAALCWAVAVTIFRGPIGNYGALAVNLFKCLVASIALGLTVIFSGQWLALIHAPHHELGWLMLSGIFGLVLGDSALFSAVRRIGGHSTLLLQTLAPVFTVSMALAMGERLKLYQWIGGLIIMIGVVMVVDSKNREDRSGGMNISGLIFGLLAAFGQGVGIVLAKMGMVTVPPVPATLFRLLTAGAGMLVVLVVSGGLGKFRCLLGSAPALKRVIPASLIGTYIAMMLMMIGVSLAPASIAAVLLSMPPIFSLLVEFGVDHKAPSRGAIIGTLVSVFGVAILSSAG